MKYENQKKKKSKKWIEIDVHLYFNRFRVEWGATHTWLQEPNQNECPRIDGKGISFQSNDGSWF